MRPSANNASQVRMLDPISACSPSADLQTLNVTAIIPVRRHASQGLGLSEPLVVNTIEAARAARHIQRVVIATDDADVARQAAKWGAEAPFTRPMGLSAPHVRADDVLRFVLEQLSDRGESPDIVVPLESTYPFRPEGLLDALVERLLTEDVDTVIPGFSEYRPCWHGSGHAFERIDEHEKIRAQRDPVIIGLPSLGCATRPEVIEQGTRLGRRVGIIEIHDPIAAIEIRDPADLKLMETLQHIVPQWRRMLREEPALAAGK